MFILLFLLNCFALSNESLQCLNKDKSNVDWYSIIIYKKKYEAENQLFYNYFDSNKVSYTNLRYDKNTFPPFYINDIIKSNAGTANYVNYNSDYKKGIFVFDSTSSIFLYHSIDDLPFGESFDISSFDLSNDTVATFLCISLDKDGTDDIANTVNLIDAPHSKNYTVQFSKENKIDSTSPLYTLIDGGLSDFPKSSIITNLRTLVNGDLFTVFTKHQNTKEHPIESSLREYYQTGFFSKSCSINIQATDCRFHDKRIININELTYNSEYYNRFTSGYEDKTKWLVGIAEDIVCTGDLDRSIENKENTGNIICFKSKEVASFLRGSISTYVNCEGQAVYYFGGVDLDYYGSESEE